MNATRILTADIKWPEPEAIAAERIVSGNPVASTLVLRDDPGHQLGLWHVTEGSFRTDHAGYVEYIHILAGRGQLVDEEDNVINLEPGVTVLMDAGWRGRWIVHEAIIKTYTIVNQ